MIIEKMADDNRILEISGDLCQDTPKVFELGNIDEQQHSIIKGDSVGETLYSAKWILSVLMSLTKDCEEGWSRSVENDLCTLWDMTTDKDIIRFLLQNDFYKVAEHLLKSVEEPRLTEIIIGIIGNMCCESEARLELLNASSLVSQILSMICINDKETVIQVLRILQSAVWDIKQNSQSPWLNVLMNSPILGESTTFILRNSLSDELLTPTIEFIYLVSEIKLLDSDNSLLQKIFNIDELIFGLCEAMLELIIPKSDAHSDAQLKIIESWINIIFNISEMDLLRFSDTEYDTNFQKLNSVLIRVLQPYETLSNLFPAEDKCLICIQRCIKIALSFVKSCVLPFPEVTKIILVIMVNFQTAATEDEFEHIEDFQLLHEYSLFFWIETLKIIEKEQIEKILQCCNVDAVKSIIQITKSSTEKAVGTTITEDSLCKLLQAESALTIVP